LIVLVALICRCGETLTSIAPHSRSIGTIPHRDRGLVGEGVGGEGGGTPSYLDPVPGISPGVLSNTRFHQLRIPRNLGIALRPGVCGIPPYRLPWADYTPWNTISTVSGAY
jgi:hypothetical protein